MITSIDVGNFIWAGIATAAYAAVAVRVVLDHPLEFIDKAVIGVAFLTTVAIAWGKVPA